MGFWRHGRLDESTHHPHPGASGKRESSLPTGHPPASSVPRPPPIFRVDASPGHKGARKSHFSPPGAEGRPGAAHLWARCARWPHLSTCQLEGRRSGAPQGWTFSAPGARLGWEETEEERPASHPVSRPSRFPNAQSRGHCCLQHRGDLALQSHGLWSARDTGLAPGVAQPPGPRAAWAPAPAPLSDLGRPGPTLLLPRGPGP